MVTKFERLKARAEALGGTLSKHDSMITPWGWKNIKYDIVIPNVLCQVETLKEVEQILEDCEKEMGVEK